MITKAQVQKMYFDNSLDLTDKEADEITAQANETASKTFQDIDAHGWVTRWIKDELREHMDCSSFSERLEYDFSQN